MTEKKDIKKQVEIKCKRFSWKQFLTTFLILGFIAITQTQIMGAFFQIQAMTKEWYYFISLALFWGGIAFVYILIQRQQIKKNFGEPLQKLCEATQEVSEGDFSVYLETVNLPNEYEYIKTAYNNFNKMVRELSSIETLKTNFIADVSHELKTPLAVIQNYGSIMQNQNITKNERIECANTIVEATQKLTILITNILKLNRLENQSMIIERKSFDLCSQLSDCVLWFADQLEKKEIKFEAEIDDFCRINSDENMLMIVWQNLLSNSIKFSETGGIIRLFQKQSEKDITVSIEDTGCGMGIETQKHIFDKFYQGDTSRSSEGNGLGLALCSRVINLIGGDINVESKIGKGTIFTITLRK